MFWFFFSMEEGKWGMEEFKEIKFSLPQTGQRKQLGFCLESTDIKNSRQIPLGGVLKHFLIQRISVWKSWYSLLGPLPFRTVWAASSVMCTHIIPLWQWQWLLAQKINTRKVFMHLYCIECDKCFPFLKNKTLAFSAFVLHLLPSVLFLLAGNENNSWLSVDCQWSMEGLKASLVSLKLLFKNNSVPVHVKSRIILSSDHNYCSERTRSIFYLCQ